MDMPYTIFDWIGDHSVIIFVITILILSVVYVIKDAAVLLYKCRKAGFKVATADKAHGIILGKKFGFLRVYSPVKSEDHVAVFGGSGSGKSTAVGTASLRTWNGYNTGFFAIDISGDISSNVDRTDCLIFEPLDPDTIPYNVFASIDCITDPIEKDEAVIRLVRTLLPESDSTDAGKWFEDRGRDILEAAFLTYYHQDLDFSDICDRIVSSSYAKLFTDIDEFGYKEAVKRISQFEGASERNTAGAKGAADVAVSLFASERMRSSFRRPFIGERCMTADSIEYRNVFFVIPDSMLEQTAPAVELVVGQLLSYLSARPPEKTRRRLLLLLDEFATFRHLDITPLLQKYRKRGVRVMIMLQSLSQLDRNYGQNVRREIIDNCRINVLCEVTEPDSQEYFSRKAGTHSVRDDIRDPVGNQSAGSFRQVPNYLPETFAHLTSHSVILCRGQNLKLRKAYFFQEKSYRRSR